MASYWSHTRKRSRTIPYEFTCEHCLKPSGMLEAVIEVEHEKRSKRKNLKEEEEKQLEQDVLEIMEERLISIKKDVLDKQDYDDDFKDKCPACGKPQTWGIKGMSYIPVVYAIIVAIIGLVVAIYIETSLPISIAIVLGAALIGAGIGFVPILIKKAKTKGVEPRVPTIYWPEDIIIK